MKLTFFTLTFLFVWTSIYSQNFLFNENQTGLNFSGRLSSYDQINLYGFNAGFTINGKLTLGVDLEHRNGEIFDNAQSFSPYLNYLLVKQNNDTKPISINFHTFYKSQKNTYRDSNSKLFGLGLGIFKSYYLKNNITIIPGGNLKWSHGTLYISNEEYTASDISYSLDLTAKYNNVYMTPRVLFIRGMQIFEVDFGVVISGNNGKKKED